MSPPLTVLKLRAVEKAIAGRHGDVGLGNPCDHDIVRATLAKLTENGTGETKRPARPLRLEHYRAIRKRAYEPRAGRGGHMESESMARERGSIDVAMIGLMREAQLGAREAAELTWGDVVRVSDGTGRVCVRGSENGELRVISSDTMRLLEPIRRGRGDDKTVIGLSRNRIAIRIGEAAEQAGLGQGFKGDSPRQGMILDMETLGVLLLAD